MTRLLVWDFDGTLADSFDAIKAAANEALVGCGHPPADEATLRASIGLSLPTVFTRLLARAARGSNVDIDIDIHIDPTTLADLLDAYRSAFARTGPEYTRLFPGVRDLLDDLRDAGVTSAIATSKTHRGVKILLEGLGLGGCFATIVGDDDVTHKKPYPEMVLAACAAHARRTCDALVIGDTEFDIEMGQRAGAATCGVTWGNQSREQLAARQPTYLATTVTELRSVLAQELSPARSAALGSEPGAERDQHRTYDAVDGTAHSYPGE